jgi:hypothetical protein
MADYWGRIDFTNLCRLWKDHKELFEMVDFKDGKHALLKVNFNERQQADEHGNTHYLKANCRKADQKEGVNYYISSGFKPSMQQASDNPAPTDSAAAENDPNLPF